MTDENRDHLASNLVRHLSNAEERIRLRQCAVFYRADPDYATRVAEGVRVSLAEVERLAAMSDKDRVSATLAGAGEATPAAAR